MERFVKGDIVVLPFPFSDLSGSKKRPALIVANLIGSDLILCQITSESRNDSYAILLTDKEFKAGGLKQNSMIRPNKLFTADNSIILYKAGSLKENKIKDVEKELINIFKK